MASRVCFGKKRCSGLDILFRHCLLLAGNHVMSVIHRMREMTGVNARHNFEFKCNLQSHKVNWGHIDKVLNFAFIQRCIEQNQTQNVIISKCVIILCKCCLHIHYYKVCLFLKPYNTVYKSVYTSSLVSMILTTATDRSIERKL